MNSNEYQEVFRDLLVTLEDNQKFDVMRGVCLGLLFGANPDPQLREQLLLTLTALTVQASMAENGAFAEITKQLQIQPEEATKLKAYLEKLMKESKDGPAN